MTETTNVVRLQPVESSNIAEIGYDNELGLLVRFTTGKLYRYPTFPVEQFGEFATTDSFGSFFAKEVRPFFEGWPFDDQLAEPQSFGEIAFRAYTEARKGKAVSGDPIPEWADLELGVRSAWEIAANAALAAHEQELCGRASRKDNG